MKQFIGIRLDTQQHKELKKRARMSGASVSKYVRTIINIHFKKDFVNRLAIFEALIVGTVDISNSLSNLTSNLNQIAYKLNSYQDVEIKHIIKTQDDIFKILKKLQLRHGKLERALLSIQKKEITR